MGLVSTYAIRLEIMNPVMNKEQQLIIIIFNNNNNDQLI